MNNEKVYEELAKALIDKAEELGVDPFTFHDFVRQFYHAETEAIRKILEVD